MTINEFKELTKDLPETAQIRFAYINDNVSIWIKPTVIRLVEPYIKDDILMVVLETE